MITKQDIDANRPVIVKWDKALLNTNGQVTEGVLAGQAEEFITRIEEESELLSELRYLEMDGETLDIQGLRVRAKLKNMNKLSGSSKGAQIDDITLLDETTPDILKTTLKAQPFTAYTTIPKTFLKTNIEKEGFIGKYESLLIPSCAFSAEQIAVFGKIPSTSQTAEGTEALNGILAQLDDVKTNYTTASTTDPKVPMGKFTDINATTPVLTQIDEMLNQYTKQRGKRKLAKIFVSSRMESLMIAEASKRETDGGDRLLFNDVGNMMFRGREVVQLDVLDNPVNDYGDVVLIANPDSIAYGPVMEAESESQYDIKMKSYITSVDFMFDVAVIYAEDVLYAKVDYSPSG